MPKPVCVACQRFFRPEKNGYVWTEMKPMETPAAPGILEPYKWEPYKVWRSDLWKCQGCGHEIIVGHSECPVSQDYRSDFQRTLEFSQSVVNDC